MWVVQVSGEVINPGVYELPGGSRVRDAVQAAGGLSAGADATGINLEAFLEDGQYIFIPDGSLLSTEPARRGSSLSITSEPDPVQGTPDNATASGLDNINTADLEELDGLPEIGPVLGKNIIDYRTLHGPFVAIEDIMNVPRIGQVIFDQIKGLITAGP
jgi:competence protein ComEA